MRNENEQLKLENEFLTTSQKSTSDRSSIFSSNFVFIPKFNFIRIHVMEKELEVLRLDIKEEREKVKNLSAWKDQISEKNQVLCVENER